LHVCSTEPGGNNHGLIYIQYQFVPLLPREMMSVLCLPVRHALGVGPSEAQPSIQQTFNMRVRDEQVPWKGASAALGLYIYEQY